MENKNKLFANKQAAIKVLHTEWSDGWGGQEIRIISEMLAMRDQGIKVFLACKGNAQIKIKAQEADIPVFILPFRGNADLPTLIKLMRIIKEQNIDIVNTHSGKDTWVGGFAAKFCGVKFIRTRHLSNKIKSSRLNFINELADYIFTTGEQVREAMINNNRIDANKILSVATGIDEQRFDPTRYDKSALRQKLGFSDDDFIIGIIAVLRGFKRHDLFLQMAKRILQRYPKIKFLIAGEGPQRPKIEHLINEYQLQDSVILTGHVENVPEYLSILDIFVLSSDSNEGVPQSVMQALMMSLPVVATDVGSTRDLLNKDNFVLIPPNNVDVMSDSVVDLIEDDLARRQYSKNARDFVVKYFGSSAMVAKIDKVYHQLIP